MKTRIRNLGISGALVLLLLALLFGTLACAGIAGTIKPDGGPGLAVDLTFGPPRYAEEEDELPRAGAVQTGLFLVDELEVRTDVAVGDDINVVDDATVGGDIVGGDNFTLTNDALVGGDMIVVGTFTGSGGSFTGTTTLWTVVITGNAGISGTLTVLDCIILENGEMICNDPDGQVEITTPNFLVGTDIAMAAGVDHSTIGGGETNYISGTVHHAFIGGGVDNEISGDGHWGVIGGGDSNLVDAASGTVGGGDNNIASGSWGFVGGGDTNTASGQESVVGGGMNNEAAGEDSVVAGGYDNTIPAAGDYSFIGAGDDNLIGDAYSSVVGGVTNTVESEFAFIGGGQTNLIDAAATWSTIGGGYNNEISAGAIKSFIGGGYTNTVSGDFSVIPGGGDNVASADYTYAAGRRAKATYPGAWVWADSSDVDYTSVATNTFNVRATEGAYFSDDITFGDTIRDEVWVYGQMRSWDGTDYWADVPDVAALTRAGGWHASYNITGWNGETNFQAIFANAQITDTSANVTAYGIEGGATYRAVVGTGTTTGIGVMGHVVATETATIPLAYGFYSRLETDGVHDYITSGANFMADLDNSGEITTSRVLYTEADTWDYGVDLSNATIGTADYVMSQGEYFANTTDDEIDVGIGGAVDFVFKANELELSVGSTINPENATMAGPVFVVYQTITYGITSTVTSAVIPANADVVDWTLVVYTAFDGGGADTIVCGFDDDADQFIDDLDASAAGRNEAGDAADTQQDEWATSFGDIGAANRTVQCQYTDANLDASAGGATFMLWYRID